MVEQKLHEVTTARQNLLDVYADLDRFTDELLML
jgi:hypothetical protein